MSLILFTSSNEARNLSIPSAAPLNSFVASERFPTDSAALSEDKAISLIDEAGFFAFSSMLSNAFEIPEISLTAPITPATTATIPRAPFKA